MSRDTGKSHPGKDPSGGPPAAVSRHRDQSGAPVSPGDDLGRLTALRERLEGVLADPDTSPRDLAALSREYRLLVAQVAAMSPGGVASALDEIAERRQRRGVS